MKPWLILYLLLITALPVFAGDIKAAREHLRAAEASVRSGSLFVAIDEYRQAITLGLKDAEIQQQLSILLYHQGFVSEAIKTMEGAVRLSSETDYLQHELGVLYFATGRLEDARECFLNALKINPGLADSHYYLAHVFARQQNRTAARLFARSAADLGRFSRETLKLSELDGFERELDAWEVRGDRIHLRQILVAERNSAEEILQRITSGQLFELVAREDSLGGDRDRGGYAGGFAPRDLHPKIVSALSFVKPLDPPQVVELDAGFTIVQRLTPLNWAYIDGLIDQKVSQEEISVTATETPREPLEETFLKDVAELSVPTDETAVAEPVPVEGEYMVRAGAFNDKAYAQERIERLKALGFHGSYLFREPHKRGYWYIAVAAVFPTYDQAREAVSRIKKNKLEAFIQQ